VEVHRGLEEQVFERVHVALIREVEPDSGDLAPADGGHVVADLPHEGRRDHGGRVQSLLRLEAVLAPAHEPR